MSDIEWLRS